ncbi:MAG TPA: AIPR family protein [Planctomycetaceae bacterium]|jgi:hypothetical protein|nr:AIPR family protein [Planctomycetaceae bacterium]
MTKRDRIAQKAKQLLAATPAGLRFSQLISALTKAFPGEPNGTLTGYTFNLHTQYPDDIYRPRRGVFRLTKYRSKAELEEDLVFQKESAITMADFKDTIAEIRARFPHLKRDAVFVLWFLVAHLAEDEDQAAKALVGGVGDKGADAIWIDEASKAVLIVQAKFRETLGEKVENRNDVLGLLNIARHLSQTDDDKFKSQLAGMEPTVAARLPQARNRFLRGGFRLLLYYVTLGRVSNTIRNDAAAGLDDLSRLVSMEIVDSASAAVIMRNYLDGIAPSIPSCNLEIEEGDQVRVKTIAERNDEKNSIECRVLSMRGDKIAELYERARIRLFARNVRGYLGQSPPVNDAMKETLQDEPDRFFYYNNGITILCDDAESKKRDGKETLHVKHPQIINGQQTTRTLAAHPRLAANASVMVKVIAVKQQSSGDKQFNDLLSSIVVGTNFQSPIKQSDLRSNDRIQVALERSLRKLGYAYIRKRQSSSEQKVSVGGKQYHPIKKEDFAQAVAACEIDGYIARSSKEKLFDEENYKDIFKSPEPFFYLARYWLMNQVGRHLRRKDGRRETRWLVIRFLWSRLSPALKGNGRLRAFSEQCQHAETALVGPLGKAINAAAGRAMRFYKAAKGKRADQVDMPTFFKSKRSSVNEFMEYLRKSEIAIPGLEVQLARIGQALEQ